MELPPHLHFPKYFLFSSYKIEETTASEMAFWKHTGFQTYSRRNREFFGKINEAWDSVGKRSSMAPVKTLLLTSTALWMRFSFLPHTVTTTAGNPFYLFLSSCLIPMSR